MDVCMYVYMYVCEYVCVHVFIMCLCVYACMYVCMSVCMQRIVFSHRSNMHSEAQQFCFPACMCVCLCISIFSHASSCLCVTLVLLQCWPEVEQNTNHIFGQVVWCWHMIGPIYHGEQGLSGFPAARGSIGQPQVSQQTTCKDCSSETIRYDRWCQKSPRICPCASRC